MARRSAPQHAAPAYRAAVVLCLLSGPIHGFLVGPARTGSTAANHAPHTHHAASPVGAATGGRVSQMRCNAVAASPVAEELAPEEVLQVAAAATAAAAAVAGTAPRPGSSTASKFQPIKLYKYACSSALKMDLNVGSTFPFFELQTDDAEFTSEVLTVEKGEGGKRVDSFLGGRIPEQSRSYFGGLCKMGMVLVGGEVVKKSVKVEEGQEVEARFIVSPELSVEGEDIPLDILYEDTEIIAVSKPPGMVVHPAPGSWNGTFVNALVYHLEKSAEDSEEGVFQSQTDARDGEHNPGMRPGIVHRLDKGTTGVLLAAKNPTMQAKLAALFAKRQITKSYLAVCVGNPGQGATIDVPIGRHPNHRQRMVAVASMQPNIRARRAVSIVSTAAYDGKLSVVEVGIETGRTHQIRVHLQHRRTPVLGDDVYGNNDWNRRLQSSTGMTRPLLHAHSLEFKHPGTGKVISLVAPLPADMESVVRRIYPQVDDEHPEWLGAEPQESDSTLAATEGDAERTEFDVPEDLRDYSLS